MRKLLFILLIIMLYFSFNYGMKYLNYALDLEVEKEINEAKVSLTPSEPRWVDEAIYIEEHKDDIKPKFETVVSQYEARFDLLKTETLDHIEQLKTEVLGNLNTETNPLTLGMTILKYEKKAEQLEQEIDQTFDDFFKNYLSRLHQLGYSTTPVKKLERQYEYTKRNIKNELVQEANSWIEEQKRF
ncbi:hypothetical protein E3U55_02550 [Filobacillus milosensis]|uniref:Uncharacterized protein n=1 Tax=Filobacillus milosensis TaxID=94137 RepID=A0A4Y8IVR2_9BACI|nr:hypothetical protein [Filobacillus milosensis]TFB24398.1 hypothetical protein E3U55_02550 [Filobacillus milosensis]